MLSTGARATVGPWEVMMDLTPRRKSPKSSLFAIKDYLHDIYDEDVEISPSGLVMSFYLTNLVRKSLLSPARTISKKTNGVINELDYESAVFIKKAAINILCMSQIIFDGVVVALSFLLSPPLFNLPILFLIIFTTALTSLLPIIVLIIPAFLLPIGFCIYAHSLHMCESTI